MRRPAALLALALFLPVLVGAMVTVKRPIPPLLVVEAEAPRIGLVQIQVPDDVLATAPSGLSDITGMITRAVERYLERHSRHAGFRNYLDLGFEATLRPATAAGAQGVVEVVSVDGLPAEVDADLVTVVAVSEWRISSFRVPGGKTMDVAHVGLVLSTWTRDGRKVHEQAVTAELTQSIIGFKGKTVLKTSPALATTTLQTPDGPEKASLEAVYYLAADGHPDPTNTPSDRAGLFARAVQDAVEVHFFPFLPHVVVERVTMKGARLNKDGITRAQEGDFGAAADAFAGAAADTPTDPWAHHNLGISRWVLGDLDGARQSLSRAVDLAKGKVYRTALDRFDAERRMVRTLAAPPAPDAPEPVGTVDDAIAP